jgi:hypothetical protein
LVEAMTAELQSLPDPLITPLLALLKDAINADVAAAMVAAGLTVAGDSDGAGEDAAVITTLARPFELRVEGNEALPALHCYRTQARTRQFTAVHLDHLYTLQFVYVTPAVEKDQLDERWPLLDIVWRSLVTTLKKGHHPAHLAGAHVLCDAGVVRADYATALKREMCVEGEHFNNPGFIAQVEVTWRDLSKEDTTGLPLALSFDARVYVDQPDLSAPGIGPDVTARAVTDAGIAASPPDGRTFTTPSDWSL